jgi:hypothetical protein
LDCCSARGCTCSCKDSAIKTGCKCCDKKQNNLALATSLHFKGVLLRRLQRLYEAREDVVHACTIRLRVLGSKNYLYAESKLELDGIGSRLAAFPDQPAQPVQPALDQTGSALLDFQQFLADPQELDSWVDNLCYFDRA